ncbi:uncharacterized protein SAPINGB_P001090 [Magnusiomyces paraingens]|uniref:Uncharacterized protein n=1 Tax=Magnusiomyces paraingens TaxID=2606893 RepID=A0A5E8B3Y2_9ASCO|nr:uncharacterized protein SAPINGB_P001090 [Saprochaete ingens]VVT46189.1 unnamed protein product [Saprochaete ingens]
MSQHRGIIVITISFFFVSLMAINFFFFNSNNIRIFSSLQDSTLTPVDRLWTNSPFKVLTHQNRHNAYNRLTSAEREKYIKYLYMFEGSHPQQGSKLRPDYQKLKRILDRRIRETLEQPQNQPGYNNGGTEESLQREMKALSKTKSLKTENDKPEYESDLEETENVLKSSSHINSNSNSKSEGSLNKDSNQGTGSTKQKRWWYDNSQKSELEDIYQKKLPNEREADDWLREVIGHESGL